MRTAGMFVLHVEPETTAMPRRVSIGLTGAPPVHQGVLHVTPNWTSWRAASTPYKTSWTSFEGKPSASSWPA
jgi:hypothetical protein